MDPRNRKEEQCNLPKEEVIALKQLINLQKNKIIIIRPCDKGAGIVVLDFVMNMRTCYDHLLSKQLNPNNIEEEGKSNYQKED